MEPTRLTTIERLERLIKVLDRNLYRGFCFFRIEGPQILHSITKEFWKLEEVKISPAKTERQIMFYTISFHFLTATFQDMQLWYHITMVRDTSRLDYHFSRERTLEEQRRLELPPSGPLWLYFTFKIDKVNSARLVFSPIEPDVAKELEAAINEPIPVTEYYELEGDVFHASSNFQK